MRRLIFIAALLAAGAALAQGKKASPEPAVTYKKTTEFTFSDETIDGELMKPDGEYVAARKRSKQPNLLRLREDFRKKVLNSASSL